MLIIKRFKFSTSSFLFGADFLSHKFRNLIIILPLPFKITPKQNFNQDRIDPLWIAIQSNDAAFEIFFKKYFSSLCSYSQTKFGFDIDLSKEVVHAGFIKLWESRQTLRDDLSIIAYLHKIITNSCIDILRHQQVKLKHEKYVLQSNCDRVSHHGFNNPDNKYLADDVNKAVSALPEQMRKIFELSRYEGLKYAEIASHLNISIKTVETQMSRALVKLRKSLSDYLSLLFIVFLLNF